MVDFVQDRNVGLLVLRAGVFPWQAVRPTVAAEGGDSLPPCVKTLLLGGNSTLWSICRHGGCQGSSSTRHVLPRGGAAPPATTHVLLMGRVMSSQARVSPRKSGWTFLALSLRIAAVAVAAVGLGLETDEEPSS